MEQRLHRIIHIIQLIFSKQVILLLFFRQILLISESHEALVCFGLSGDSDKNKIFVRSEVKIGRGDLIEVYLSQDDVLLTLSNHLPVEMTLHTAQFTLT